MAALLQWFLSVVFAGAALTKLTAYDRFLRALTSLAWLSASSARRVARVIPFVELALVALLLSFPRVGAIAALATLGLFTAVVGAELLGGRDFRCGCFGAAETQPAGKSTLFRNAVLATVAALLLFLPASTEIGAILVGVALGLLFLLIEIGVETTRLERVR